LYPPRPLPAWAARLAQSKTGLRFLHVLIGARQKLVGLRRAAPVPRSHPIRDEINRVRASVKLPEIGGSSGVGPAKPQRIVCMWPDWFADRQRDWPSEMVIAGFPFPPPSDGKPEGVADRSANTNGIQPLVFTTGSIACKQEAFFADAVEACRILKRPGLLVTPHADQVPRPLPPDVTHLAYAPFEDLFARSALVVHHGGIGTIALALAAGVPQIVRPMMGEQFDLGNRMQRLGVGRMIPGESITPTQLARLIDSLLRSERVSTECRRLQARIDRGAGLTRAADSIESLAG
jgi:UDP:flavonoid glycosyltransferase YjiC (YdhE family)